MYTDKVYFRQSPTHIITQDAEVVAQYGKSLQILRGLGATVFDDFQFPEWTVSTREENEAVLDLSFHTLAKISTAIYFLFSNSY